MARISALARVLPVLTGAAILFGLSTNADAYAVKRTSRGELVHWDERGVDFTVDPAVDRAVTRATDATLSAMDAWGGSVGAPDLHIVPQDASAPTTAGFDHKNGVFYSKGGYAPAGRALAITVLTYDNASGRILDADVIFNGTYNFKVLAAPGEILPKPGPDTSTHPSAATDGIGHGGDGSVLSSGAVYDLHHVIAHELGHSLGMNDEMGRTDALMYRYSAPNDATMRQPSPDDIAGLAELYSTKLEGRGNGCGSATIAPKKPSDAASRAAAVAMLGLLVFLVLRAKSDRRARIAFVVAAAGATIAFVPSLSGKHGPGLARASEGAVGHARARVTAADTTLEAGLFKTTYKLVTTDCHLTVCPKDGRGTTWGGTIGNITQEVGDNFAPAPGDDVDVSYVTVPNSLAALKPLAGRQQVSADVRVLTAAR